MAAWLDLRLHHVSAFTAGVKGARPSARCHDRSKRALTHVWLFWMHSSRMKLVHEHAAESAVTRSDCPEWLHFSGKASSIWRKSHHSCMCFACSTCEDTVNVWKQMAVFTFHVGTDLLPEVEGKSIYSCVIEILRLLTRGTLPDHFLDLFQTFSTLSCGKM